MKNNEQGRSMIEMLGVLAIIGVLSVGGIAGYSKAMAKYRVNRTIDQVAMVVSGIQTLFANQRDRYIGADDINVLEKAKIIDSSAIEEITTTAFDEDQYNQKMGQITNGADRYGTCSYILMIINNPDEYSRCEAAWNNGTISDYVRSTYTTETSGKAIVTPYGGHMVITAGDKIFALNLLEVPSEMCIELATLDWNGTVDGGTSVSVGGRTSNGQAMSVADATAGCSADYNTIVMTFK